MRRFNYFVTQILLRFVFAASAAAMCYSSVLLVRATNIIYSNADHTVFIALTVQLGANIVKINIAGMMLNN